MRPWLLSDFLLLLACCSSTPRLPDVEPVFRHTRLLVLGEVHGTQEAPRFALDVVRAALESDGSVALCLEIERGEQARIDRYLSSAGLERDREELLASDHWRIGSLDGRGSEAMVELIEGVRQLAASGSRVRISCFVDLTMPASPEAFDPAAYAKENWLAGSWRSSRESPRVG